MTTQSRHFVLASADITAQLAQALGAQLGRGDVVLLEGPVGAGKTHFARALIQSLLPFPEDVPSPTFTLVQTYETPAGDIWHADLYRLSSNFEVEELGLLDAFETAISLIEWPDRLGPLVPEQALTLAFGDGDTDDSRHLSAKWTNPRWDQKLRGWGP